MALFTNYATLSYNGQTLTSNTVTGEILETVSVSKTALADSYTTGDDLVYVVSLANSGEAELSGITLTDDLGGYTFDGETVYPLEYLDGTLRYFVNGELQAAPAVTAGPPLAVSGLSIPAGGNILLVYQARATAYAPLGEGGEIVNTATASGAGVSDEACATVPAAQEAELSINKALSPAVVSPNETLTYTFTIENSGPQAATDVVLTDTFDPVLANISVDYNGSAWSAANYQYDAATGVFTTAAGRISVPAATYAQGTDGAWTTTPGTVTLSVSGEVQPGA